MDQRAVTILASSFLVGAVLSGCSSNSVSLDRIPISGSHKTLSPHELNRADSTPAQEQEKPSVRSEDYSTSKDEMPRGKVPPFSNPSVSRSPDDPS